jgi:hypothetical protein
MQGVRCAADNLDAINCVFRICGMGPRRFPTLPSESDPRFNALKATRHSRARLIIWTLKYCTLGGMALQHWPLGSALQVTRS